MRKLIKIIVIVLALIAIAFAFGLFASFLKIGGYQGGEVGLIRLEGEILTSTDLLEKIKKVEEDPSIKAVVLRIDSPGGAVSASQEMFEEVKKLSIKKPVVVSMGDVAASGGYYVACGARKIFANPATITGSIGVRMEHINVKELLTLIKVSHETLKSGYFKDMGAIDRQMTEEERALFNELLSSLHRQFKVAVSSSRGIPMEKVEDLADGRVYTGEQALTLGLIDELGTVNSAIAAAGAMVGIKGVPEVKEIEEDKSFVESLFGEKALSFAHELIHGRLAVRSFSY